MSLQTNSLKVGATWLPVVFMLIFGGYAIENCLAQDIEDGSYSLPENMMFPGFPLDKDILTKSREIVFRRNLGDEARDFMTRVDDAKPINIAQLESAENLESLVINMVDLKPLEIKRLAKLRKLKRIEYPNMTRSDEKILAIATLPFLEELDLFGSDTSSRSGEHLAKMKKLQQLDLRDTKVDSELFARHSLAEGVTHLSVSSKEIDVRFLSNSKLPRSLTHLYVERNGEWQFSQTPDLKHLKQLQVLLVHGIFTKPQIKEIREQLPNTKINPETVHW